jgi:hypothetical protein
MKRAAIKHPTHFHPLTQNTIKAFKSRAQAVFSFLEKTPPPPPSWFTNLHYKYSRKIIYQKLDTNSCFAKLRTISNLFNFF